MHTRTGERIALDDASLAEQVRNLWAVRLTDGIVTDLRTLPGADDCAWCDGAMRYVTECPE